MQPSRHIQQYWTNTSQTAATSPTFTWSYATNNATTASTDDWVSLVPMIPADLPAGQRTLGLPDGSKLHIDDAGNYRIDDKDAKVTYKANRIREFSPHLNASDMLASFVKYVGSLGLRQSEVLGLPLELFVNWLIIEAAERDQDPIPSDVVRVERHAALLTVRRPKCLACGRFIPKVLHENRFPFCRLEHGVKFVERRKLIGA